MARYFRGEPSDKSDCGGDETEEKKSGLNFTPHAPCQFSAAVKRAKVPRGPPPAYCHSAQGATKGFRPGQLGNVKPPIKTSMRVTKNNYFKHSFINHPFFNFLGNGARNGTFCE